MERADEIAVAHDDARLRAKMCAEMGAIGVGHAHRAGAVAPGDDLPAHPPLLQELLGTEPRARLDEVPAVREGVQRMIAVEMHSLLVLAALRPRVQRLPVLVPPDVFEAFSGRAGREFGFTKPRRPRLCSPRRSR